ncbi:hypothetical protein T265_15047, partial [Opisthorchis viverrini]
AGTHWASSVRQQNPLKLCGSGQSIVSVSLPSVVRLTQKNPKQTVVSLKEDNFTHSRDVRRLQVFDHGCLRSVAGCGWRQCVSNEAIRKRVFGCFAGPQSGKTSSIIDYDGSVMCYACQNTVYRDECCSPCLIQDGANREDGVLVTLSVLGWRRCKKWRLIDDSDVRANSFFPDCLIERSEVGRCQKELMLLNSSLPTIPQPSVSRSRSLLNLAKSVRQTRQSKSQNDLDRKLAVSHDNLHDGDMNSSTALQRHQS